MGLSSVDYLGHHITAACMTFLPSRVEAVAAFPPSATKSHLQGFLGMINFYRQFIKGVASILKPDATKGNGGRHQPVQWLPAMAAVFEKAKATLANAATLAHPDETVELSLAVDASDHHVGGVLQQRARVPELPGSPYRFQLQAV